MLLTHWGRVTHICVSKFTIIGSDNGLSPGRHQAIIWTNAGILLIGPLGTNFSEISITIQTFSLKKRHLKMSSGKCRPFCLGLNVLKMAPVVTTLKKIYWCLVFMLVLVLDHTLIQWMQQWVNTNLLILWIPNKYDNVLVFCWTTSFHFTLAYCGGCFQRSSKDIKFMIAFSSVLGNEGYQALLSLSHLPLDKMADISQTIFSDAFSWMKNFD